jgi:hypothetical protein
MSENPPDVILQARHSVGPDFIGIDGYLGNGKFIRVETGKLRFPGREAQKPSHADHIRVWFSL